jgi:hypothetical protein
MTDIARRMAGGGWCVGTDSEGGCGPLLDEDAVDVTWASARSALVETLELWRKLFGRGENAWDARQLDALDELRDCVSVSPPGTPIEAKVGPVGDVTAFWLLPTGEAAQRGALLELLCTRGNRRWIERGSLPSV